jgi:tetratricopeptide (TPR) repeat protein
VVHSGSVDELLQPPDAVGDLAEDGSDRVALAQSEKVKAIRVLFDHIDIDAAPPSSESDEEPRMELQQISCDPRWREQGFLSSQAALFAATRCFDLGDLNAAEDYCKAAWRSCPLTSSPDGYQALQAYNYLAFIHAEKREFSIAEAEFMEVLEHSRILYGTTHPMTISSLSSLAKVYSLQEKYSQAEPLFIELFHIHDTSSERDLRRALTALRDLAQNHFRQQQYDLAKSEQERVVDKSRALLGPADGFTEESLWSLLQMYHNLGDLEELEQIIRRQYFESKHRLDFAVPDRNALWTLRCLAYIHMLQDHFKDALEEVLRLSLLSKRIDERLLEVGEVIQPTSEPAPSCIPNRLTLIFDTHVSAMLPVSGLYEECLTLNRRLLQQLVATYDFDHRVTLNCISVLGQCNSALGSFNEAKKLLRRAVDGFRKLRDRKRVLHNSIRLLTCLAEGETYHMPDFIELTISSMANMDLVDRVGSLDVVEVALKFLAQRRDVANFRLILGETLPAAFQALDSKIGPSRLVLNFLAYCASELNNLGLGEMGDPLVSRLAYEVIILDPKPRLWSKKALKCIGLYELRHENWRNAEMYLLAAKFHSINLLGPVHVETKILDVPIATVSRNLHKPSGNLGSDVRLPSLPSSTTSTYYDLLSQSSLFAFRCRSSLKDNSDQLNIASSANSQQDLDSITVE